MNEFLNSRYFDLLMCFVGVLALAAFALGWVSNIVQIAGSDFNDLTTFLVLRFIGIFVAPLGAILGYF
jgi:hypothetical protein